MKKYIITFMLPMLLLLSGNLTASELKIVTITIHKFELKTGHDDGGRCNSCLEIYLNLYVNSDFSRVPATYYNNITPGDVVDINKKVILKLRKDDPLTIKVTAYDNDPNSENDPLGTFIDRHNSVSSAKGVHHQSGERRGNGSYDIIYSVSID